MNNDKYKLKVQELIRKSREKGLIKTYDEFLETDEAKEYFATFRYPSSISTLKLEKKLSPSAFVTIDSF